MLMLVAWLMPTLRLQYKSPTLDHEDRIGWGFKSLTLGGLS